MRYYGYTTEMFIYPEFHFECMQSFEQQLNRMCDWLVYYFNKRQDDKVSLVILCIEHFKNQGRPLDDQLFKIIDHRFVKTGDLELKEFWKEASYAQDG